MTASQLPVDLRQQLASLNPVERVGRVAEAYGTIVRVTGLQADIGEMCRLSNSRGGDDLHAEVVGISNGQTLLTPLGPIEGISGNTRVIATGEKASVMVGPQLLGRILDGNGQLIDQGPELTDLAQVPIYAQAPNPLTRKLVDQPLGSGVRAIDTLLSLGEGQRVGIFASAGGGKSTLLGMLARGAQAQVNVIALVGERGREVNEFILDNLGEEGLARSVVVVATSDRPALERARAAYLATAIAEYFRDQGQSVLLMMDSVTRFARALRDVGLAVGEPPARRGFPPSVFSALPQLFERAGNSEKGTMTAVYTVLKEDEEMSDPIVEEVRSILDGHIMLSRELAAAHHYPAIDVLASASRVMNRVASPAQQQAAGQLRASLAKHKEIELLLQLGEYQSGQDAAADLAIQKIDGIRELLKQGESETTSFEDAVAQLERLFR